MGNTIRTKGEPGGDLSLFYGAHQRLLDSQKGERTGSYRYNGTGERVYKSNDTQQWQYFLYDERGRLLGEYGFNGTPVAQYFWIDELLVGVFRNNALHAIHADHLTTPRAVINENGLTVWRWDSKSQPFGESPPDTDPDGDGTPFKFNLRFPGQYFDEETGLHYNYFRDYDPGVGRYVQSDPIGLSGGVNTYIYSDQNPVRFIDLFGLDVRCPMGQSASPFPGQEDRFPKIFECTPDEGAPRVPQCPFGQCAAFPESYNSECSLQCNEGPLTSCLAVVAGASAQSCMRFIASKFRDKKAGLSCVRRVNASGKCFDKYCSFDNCCE